MAASTLLQRIQKPTQISEAITAKKTEINGHLATIKSAQATLAKTNGTTVNAKKKAAANAQNAAAELEKIMAEVNGIPLGGTRVANMGRKTNLRRTVSKAKENANALKKQANAFPNEGGQTRGESLLAAGEPVNQPVAEQA